MIVLVSIGGVGTGMGVGVRETVGAEAEVSERGVAVFAIEGKGTGENR